MRNICILLGSKSQGLVYITKTCRPSELGFVVISRYAK